MWSRFEYGFDSANETVNFGTRTLAEGDALYETATLAVISSDIQIETNPSVKCLNQNANIYMAIDNTFRILSENYSNLNLPMSFDGKIDYFGISPDDNLVVLCLNDGNIHCLYTQSKGNRNIICSTLLSNIEENVISITCVTNIFNEITFIIYTNKGNCYRLNIQKLSTIYEYFLQENEDFQVEFTCELIDNIKDTTPIVKVQYDNLCFYFSQKYKQYFADTGPLILALKDGDIIGNCKLTNMDFVIWNTESLQDFIFLKNLNSMDHRLLVLTSPDNNGNCFIKLLSYPDFEAIYQLKVSINTYLVNINSEKDEIMFIEGISRNNDTIQELRLKKITESIPEVKLQRLLRKKCFEEAIQFAQFYSLSRQSVYVAQAEEYIITSNFLLTKPEEFCAILSQIDDIEFIVKHCLEISAHTLDGVQYLLDYANTNLHNVILNQCEEDSLQELRQHILNALRRLDTFRILYCQNLSLNSSELIERWSHFSGCSLLDEIRNYLINGQIDKCTLIYTRLQQETNISANIIVDILKWIPNQISLPKLVSLICNLLMSTLDSVPNALPVLMEWLYTTVLRSETMKSIDWPDNILQSATSILSLLNLKTSKIYCYQYTINDKSVIKFKNLIATLSEIIILKSDFGINVTFNEYMQEPKIIIFLLLNRVKLDEIHEFFNKVLFKLTQTHKLNLDDILVEFIENITNTQNWWEEIVLALMSFISANTKRIEMVLLVLKRAEVPWSAGVKQLADVTVKETHPLCNKIKHLEENIVVKLLLKTYSITGITNFDKEEVIFIMRRILKVSKPEMLQDLQIISSRYPQLKNDCSVLTFNHFIQKGQTIEAQKYLNDLNQDVLFRCCESVLYNTQFFLFSKRMFKDLLNNYLEVLNTIGQHLKSMLPDYKKSIYENEIHKLKNVYLLKTKYNCNTEITDAHFDLRTLLPKMVTEIIDTKTDWADATHKCEYLSCMIGVSKADCLFEFVKQCGELKGLICAAEKLLTTESSALDLCGMAILIMKNIDLNQSQTDNYQLKLECIDRKQTEDVLVRNALQLMHTLTVKAVVKASQFELQTACELLNWSRVTFWLRIEPTTISNKWRYTPLFHPENMCPHSVRILSILKEFFNIFLKFTEQRMIPHSQCFSSNIDHFEDQNITDLDLFSSKIQQLQIEGYELTTYQLLIIFKMGLKMIDTNSELFMKMKLNINTPIISRCVQQLLQKILVSKQIDQQLVLALLLTPEFKALMWIPSVSKKYKTDAKKMHAIASLSCEYIRVRNINGDLFDTYSMLKFRCDWWHKCLHYGVPYNETFILKPEDILKKYLLSSDLFNIKLLHEYCSDFNLDIQMFLPMYLQYCLLSWKHNICQTSVELNNSELELFQKCKDIIISMNNATLAITQLYAAWEEVSYYQYEVYQCILDLLSDLNDQCINNEKRMLLSFLKTYTRIGKPRQKEREDWQTKFPFSREIDTLSDYRLPFLLAMITTDIWEIIRPEVNLNTYKKWFEAASSIQLVPDDICTYAIKGTIHSGILNLNYTTWSIHPKHDTLLESMDSCADQISNLQLATAVLYQALCSMSGGADQLIIAKMCLTKGMQWKKSMPNSEAMNDVWHKVKRKYLICLSNHMLYSNNLGVSKYLSLVGQTEELIKALYNDDSIIQRASGLAINCPDVNYVVDELTKNLNMDVVKLRTALIIEYIQEPNTSIDYNETYNFNKHLDTSQSDENTNYNNLLRVKYICESTNQELLKNLMYNISFSTIHDDTISLTETSSNLSTRVRALQCLLVVCNADDLRVLTGQTYDELSEFMLKLKILSTLESVGYALTIPELDECNKVNLARKILQTHSVDPCAIRTIANLCGHYHIWDSNLWNQILYLFVRLTMVPDLQEWLPKLYSCCYTPIINCNFVAGWECVINNSVLKEEDFIQAFLMIQTCPIFYKLDACLMNIFDSLFNTSHLEFCAILLPYIHKQHSKNKILQALRPYKNEQLYAKILNLAGFGIQNTTSTVNILIHYN